MVEKEKATSHLNKVRISRNKHREQTVAAKEQLRKTKEKNKALSQKLKAEKVKSAETSRLAQLDKKATLTLIDELKNPIKLNLKKNERR